MQISLKKSIIAILVVAGIYTAAATKSPIQGWITKLTGDVTVASSGAASLAANSVDSSELVNGSVDEGHLFSPTSDGLNAGRWARATYDVSGADLGTVAAHSLGVTLPAFAVIIQAFFVIEIQFVDGGSGTVALHCEDANNIFSAADITGVAVDAVTAGVGVDTIATYDVAIGAACVVTATVATAEQTAGKLILYINYVVRDGS